jgi:16S rRNA (cytosine1402-N4)-methyltransferase
MEPEITAIFGPIPTGYVIDATVGGGGHSRALLDARPDLQVVGLDQDGEALAATADRLAGYGDRVTLRQARFDQLRRVVDELGYTNVTGVLFDLGVSSPQLDHADRGVSYRSPGPLDMRMDQRGGRTADDLVNGADVGELTRILREHADERFAGRIARAIVANRPIATTTELAEVVRDAIPAPARRTGGHPAKRTFQALRIEVNDELGVLGTALDQALDILRPGGRIAVLAYHSGEDRIVKQRLQDAAAGGTAPPPGVPIRAGEEGTRPRLRLLKRGAWKPTADEVERNPRAESARLRAAEKLAQPADATGGPGDHDGPRAA